MYTDPHFQDDSSHIHISILEKMAKMILETADDQNAKS